MYYSWFFLFFNEKKGLFRLTDMGQARELKNSIIDRFLYSRHFEKSCRYLNEGLEDAILPQQFCLQRGYVGKSVF